MQQEYHSTRKARDICKYGTNDKANANMNIITNFDHKLDNLKAIIHCTIGTRSGTRQWKIHFLASERFITNSYTITYKVLRKSAANNERR